MNSNSKPTWQTEYNAINTEKLQETLNKLGPEKDNTQNVKNRRKYLQSKINADKPALKTDVKPSSESELKTDVKPSSKLNNDSDVVTFRGPNITKSSALENASKNASKNASNNGTKSYGCTCERLGKGSTFTAKGGAYKSRKKCKKCKSHKKCKSRKKCKSYKRRKN